MFILPLIWKEPSFIPGTSCGFLAGILMFVGFFILALVCMVYVERIKRNHDLVTYREISAFMEDDEVPVDDEALSRSYLGLSVLVKALCGADFRCNLIRGIDAQLRPCDHHLS